MFRLLLITQHQHIISLILTAIDKLQVTKKTLKVIKIFFFSFASDLMNWCSKHISWNVKNLIFFFFFKPRWIQCQINSYMRFFVEFPADDKLKNIFCCNIVCDDFWRVLNSWNSYQFNLHNKLKFHVFYVSTLVGVLYIFFFFDCDLCARVKYACYMIENLHNNFYIIFLCSFC